MVELVESVLDQGTGVSFATYDVVAWNRTDAATSVGSLVCLSNIASTYDTNFVGSYNPASEQYHGAQAATGSATANRCGIWGIALEVIPNEGRGRFRVKGVVKAYVTNSLNLPTSAGQGLIPLITQFQLNGTTSTAATAPRKIVGIMLGSQATTSVQADAILSDVLFDGLNGFGGAQDD